jgi:hypothetical protein
MFFENNLITLRSSSNVKDLYTDNTLYEFSNQLCTSINFRNRTRVALAEIHLPLNFRAVDKKAHEIFILSDIADDSIVGSERLNILRVMTIDKTLFTTTSQTKIFDNLFWYPLTRNSVNNIKIKIATSNSKVLPLNGTALPEEETFIVLKFK